MSFGTVIGDAQQGFTYGLQAGTGYLSFVGNSLQAARDAGASIRGGATQQQADLQNAVAMTYPYEPALAQPPADSGKDILGLIAFGILIVAVMK
jgi:hypothetical protein